jgi:hypothetical protein
MTSLHTAKASLPCEVKEFAQVFRAFLVIDNLMCNLARGLCCSGMCLSHAFLMHSWNPCILVQWASNLKVGGTVRGSGGGGARLEGNDLKSRMKWPAELDLGKVAPNLGNRKLCQFLTGLEDLVH